MVIPSTKIAVRANGECVPRNRTAFARALGIKRSAVPPVVARLHLCQYGIYQIKGGGAFGSGSIRKAADNWAASIRALGSKAVW